MKLARSNPANESELMKETALCGMGVAGEAGEVCELLKKHVFYGHPLDKTKLIREMGDVLWYMARLCEIHGIDIDSIPEENINKLKSRYTSGKFSEKESIERVDEKR